MVLAGLVGGVSGLARWGRSAPPPSAYRAGADLADGGRAGQRPGFDAAVAGAPARRRRRRFPGVAVIFCAAVVGALSGSAEAVVVRGVVHPSPTALAPLGIVQIRQQSVQLINVLLQPGARPLIVVCV